jgi:endoglucanase
MIRWFALLLALTVTQPACAGRNTAAGWEDWQAFRAAFVTDDGRVVDWSQNGRTVSEGQAYGLFFALVANDRTSFQRMLDWTDRHLADGDVSRRLPAWLWGQADDGTRKVLDPNPATDADLWIVYSLLEAARLWRVPAYETKARALLKLVREQSVVRYDNGVTLLKPAPTGFRFDDRVRLNASYLMPAQLLRLQTLEPAGPWGAILAQYPAMLAELSPTGRIPDWSQFREGRHELDTETGGVGSYDSIRVYLWAGMGPSSNPAAREVLANTKAFASMIEEAGRVPEKWAARSSWIEGEAPIGFHAALLPYYAALGDKAALQATRQRVLAAREQQLYGNPARYYDQVLVLFGKGYDDGWYRFDPAGRLVPRWKH